LARGGEVFVTKMKVIAIMDLAHAMREVFAPYFGHDPESVEIELIGAKPGEKLYEELMTSEEVGRSLNLQDMFAIIPAYRSMYHQINYVYPGETGKKVDRPYISSHEPRLTQEEIKAFLLSNQLVPKGFPLPEFQPGFSTCTS